MNMNKKIYKCLPSIDKVGIEFTKDFINIYFPLGYDIPNYNDKIIQEKEEKKAILDIIKTISLCKNNGENYKYNYNYGKNKEIPINSYLWILNDYLKNGLYNTKERHYLKMQNGKINWKRTFNTQPIFSDDEIVYLNPIVELNTKSDNIITEIHAKCVNICINKIGWIFGNIKKCEGYKQSLSDATYLKILNQELSVSYNDKKKELLNHLIKVILNKSDLDESDLTNSFLVDNYHYAWERMISKVFGNDNENIKDYFPSIKWNLRYKDYHNPKMRPDTVIEKGNVLYILDAKYYKYGVLEEGSLPGAGDIDKQITYGEFNNQKYDEVYNAFILPYNKNDNFFGNSSNILDIGNVENNARISNKQEPFKKIAIILVDTKYVIDCYFKRDKKNENELIDSIISALEYNKE